MGKQYVVWEIQLAFLPPTDNRWTCLMYAHLCKICTGTNTEPSWMPIGSFPSSIAKATRAPGIWRFGELDSSSSMPTARCKAGWACWIREKIAQERLQAENKHQLKRVLFCKIHPTFRIFANGSEGQRTECEKWESTRERWGHRDYELMRELLSP